MQGPGGQTEPGDVNQITGIFRGGENVGTEKRKPGSFPYRTNLRSSVKEQGKGRQGKQGEKNMERES